MTPSFHSFFSFLPSKSQQTLPPIHPPFTSSTQFFTSFSFSFFILFLIYYYFFFFNFLHFVFFLSHGTPLGHAPTTCSNLPWSLQFAECIILSIHSFIQSSIHPFIHPSVDPFIHSSNLPSIHSFIQASIHSFFHSLIHPSNN